MPRYLLISIAVLALTAVAASPWTARAQSRQPSRTDPQDQPNTPLSGPLAFYKRFISGADGERCPMFPTCSTYASQAFAKHGPLMGWIMASDRLLRCGRDEARSGSIVKIGGQGHIYDPLENNDFWWSRTP